MVRLFFLCAVLTTACRKIENPDDLLGNYVNASSTRKIVIVPKGEQYCGILTWTSDTSGELEVGDTLLNDLQVKGSKFVGSILYSGNSYDCKIRLENNGIEIRTAGKKRFWSKL